MAGLYFCRANISISSQSGVIHEKSSSRGHRHRCRCVYAQSAQAQLVVSLGGYTEFFGAYYDDDVPGRTSREFELETEIVVRADGKADNGLLYGAKVELQNSTPDFGTTGVGVDEASVYLSAAPGAASNSVISTAPPIPWRSMLRWSASSRSTATPTIFWPSSRMAFLSASQPIGSMVQAPDSGDATKVMYLTPRFAGIQAGISYATQDGSECPERGRLQDRRRLQGLLGSGCELHGRVRGLLRRRQRHRQHRDRQDIGIVGGPTLEDFWAWQAGAQVGYGGFKFGGGYIDAGDYNAVSGVPGSSGDSTVWHVGVSYTAGPVAVGLTYADAEGFKSGPSFDETTLAPSVGTYATSYKTYGGGVAYTIAPGFVVQADLMYVDEDLRNVDLATGAAATTSNEGYVAVLSTRLDF